MSTKLYWLPTGPSFGPGRVALSACPRDGIASVVASGVNVVVTLITHEEMADVGVSDLSEQCRAGDLTHIHQPIDDYSIPSVADAHVLVGTLRQIQSTGKNILIHCMGGLGRSGLLCALLLVDSGLDPNDAIAIVRDVRSPKAIETPEQELFVRNFR